MNASAWKISHQAVTLSSTAARQYSESVRNDSQALTRKSNVHLMRVARDTEEDLNRRLDEIAAHKAELQSAADAINVELESLRHYDATLAQELADKAEPLEIATANVQLRKKRQSPDLFEDAVDQALLTEIALLERCQQDLRKSQKDVQEAMRALRAARYQAEENLSSKSVAFDIDKTCRGLDSSLSPSSLTDTQRIRNMTEQYLAVDQWMSNTKQTLDAALQACTAGSKLRGAIDSQLCMQAELLAKQAVAVEHAFNTRIAEYRDAKHAAEQNLANTEMEMTQQEHNVEDLEASIGSKTAPLQIAQTRLTQRADRPAKELVRDQAHYSLLREVEEIERVVENLSVQKDKSVETMRSLKRAALALAEDIACKTNSLNIDNACMQRRQEYKYRKI